MPFETQEQAQNEERTRIRCLEQLISGGLEATHCSDPVTLIDRESVSNLLYRLTEGMDTGKPAPTLASAMHLRTIRVKYVNALLDAVENIVDADIATFTVINEKWRFSPHQLNGVSALSLKNSLRTHLRRAGVTAIPGLLVAALHGEYEPVSEIYQLHYHGMTTAAKAQQLKSIIGQWGYTKTATGASPLVIKSVTDRIAQFTYIFQSFWPQRTLFTTSAGEVQRDRTKRRIDEPYHTQVLVWLDRWRISDLYPAKWCSYESW